MNRIQVKFLLTFLINVIGFWLTWLIIIQFLAKAPLNPVLFWFAVFLMTVGSATITVILSEPELMARVKLPKIERGKPKRKSKDKRKSKPEKW